MGLTVRRRLIRMSFFPNRTNRSAKTVEHLLEKEGEEDEDKEDTDDKDTEDKEDRDDKADSVLLTLIIIRLRFIEMDSMQLCLAAFILGSLMSVGSCGNFTVTDEAWFEAEIKDFEGPGLHYKGVFTIALFGESAPMTVMNFAAIVRGYKRGKQTLHYKNSPIHRIVKDFVIQMGDITVGDGTGGTSIFGDKFNDEEFVLSHRAPGIVSMANRGKDTNGSQFFITMVKARWMDGKHVVFGKVIKGYDVLQIINDLETDPDSAWPRRKVRIADCGLNDMPKKYDLTEKQIESAEELS